MILSRKKSHVILLCLVKRRNQVHVPTMSQYIFQSEMCHLLCTLNVHVGELNMRMTFV